MGVPRDSVNHEAVPSSYSAVRGGRASFGMVTLTLYLVLPPPWGHGSQVQIELVLHEGYGNDAALAHTIVAAAASSDDGWVRLMKADGDLWVVPRPWLHGWRTHRDPSAGP